MPLFMILSGWFAMPEKLSKLKATAVRLVFPVFSWYLILYVVQGQYRTMPFVELIRRWIVHPDVGLWFLWVLFLCHLWLVLVRRLEAWTGLLAYFLGSVILCAIPFSYFGLTLTKYYFPFFTLGYLAARHRQHLARYSHFAFAVSVPLFLLAFQDWHRTSADLSSMRFLVAGHGVDATMPLWMASRLVCGVSGSVVFAYLLTTLVAHLPTSGWLGWLGAQTLEIYAIHQPLIPFALGQGSVAVITSLTLTTATSLGAIWVLRKNAWASLILFGRIPKNRDAHEQRPCPDLAVTPHIQSN
jgi:fucose 4-O-acetylase-like acetyltransferase